MLLHLWCCTVLQKMYFVKVTAGVGTSENHDSEPWGSNSDSSPCSIPSPVELSKQGSRTVILTCQLSLFFWSLQCMILLRILETGFYKNISSFLNWEETSCCNLLLWRNCWLYDKMGVGYNIIQQKVDYSLNFQSRYSCVCLKELNLPWRWRLEIQLSTTFVFLYDFIMA